MASSQFCIGNWQRALRARRDEVLLISNVRPPMALTLPQSKQGFGMPSSAA
jgi:hypothetical protein